MSMTPRAPSDTSVTFSLAELAQLERERVRDEEAQRARTREKDAREQREAEARRRAAEAAELAAAAEARARRAREEVEQAARVEARQKAEMEVARIAAEARARLDADNAARAHELAALRVRTEGGRGRLQAALAAVIGLAVCGGGATAYGVEQHVASLTQETARVREGQQALAREREHAKTAELGALDRRFVALAARPSAPDAAEARSTAEAARNAVDPRALDHDRLRAFGDAIDALEARLDTLERLAALDRRRDDLAAWAAERRRSEAVAPARSAAARARLACSGDAIQAYERALDQLRDALAQGSATPGPNRQQPEARSGAAKPCREDDPGCGLNGKPMF